MQKHEAKPPIDHFHFPLQTVSLRRRVTTYNHQPPTAASIIHSAVLWARCAPAASKASAAQVLSLSNLFSPLKWPFFGHIKIVKHAKKNFELWCHYWNELMKGHFTRHNMFWQWRTLFLHVFTILKPLVLPWKYCNFQNGSSKKLGDNQSSRGQLPALDSQKLPLMDRNHF